MPITMLCQYCPFTAHPPASCGVAAASPLMLCVFSMQSTPPEGLCLHVKSVHPSASSYSTSDFSQFRRMETWLRGVIQLVVERFCTRVPFTGTGITVSHIPGIGYICDCQVMLPLYQAGPWWALHPSTLFGKHAIPGRCWSATFKNIYCFCSVFFPSRDISSSSSFIPCLLVC